MRIIVEVEDADREKYHNLLYNLEVSIDRLYDNLDKLINHINKHEEKTENGEILEKKSQFGIRKHRDFT